MVTREDGQKRNELTAITYMLTLDQPMQLMCLNKSPHVHYWQGGGSLTYTVITPDSEVQSAVLGPNVDQVEVIQLGQARGWGGVWDDRRGSTARV
jgi:predicted cupin superfamily sugar epimerase